MTIHVQWIISRIRSSSQLQWQEYKIGHYDNGSSHDRQGHIHYSLWQSANTHLPNLSLSSSVSGNRAFTVSGKAKTPKPAARESVPNVASGMKRLNSDWKIKLYFTSYTLYISFDIDMEWYASEKSSPETFKIMSSKSTMSWKHVSEIPGTPFTNMV